jgi:hypothetical protein
MVWDGPGWLIIVDFEICIRQCNQPVGQLVSWSLRPHGMPAMVLANWIREERLDGQ